jgi:myosin heavy subunit
MNPYQRLQIYNEDAMARYKEAAIGSLPPHVFGVAAAAYTGLLSARSQSIVISGESGAGKSETAKKVLKHLAYSAAKSVEGEEGIEKRILASSPVLEAFGNAKTIRNDNSSRFGKFIRLLYNSDNHIVSAVTETFLLEKSRLVELGVGERCYHVFYILVAGLPQLDAALAQELKLQQQQPAAFPMLRDRAGATHASEGDASLPALAAALAKVGFSAEELSCLWSLLASILHMSNVTLKESKGDGGPVEASCSSMPLDSVAKLL